MPRVYPKAPARANVPLAPMTTLEVGGSARFFAETRGKTALLDTLAWADEAALPTLVVGGGSNLLVADAGFDGLALKLGDAAVHYDGGRVVADAGAAWDEVVAGAVARGWAGLECLSGIPGRVGAAPIQNIGAYGQEVASVIESVTALDRERGTILELDAGACRFGYRTSRFKREGSWVVLSLALRLAPGGRPSLRYPELQRAAVGRDLAGVREAVLALRRAKSMVLDPADENRRSAGSFFLNPVLSRETADRVQAEAPDGLPRWAQPDGRVKLSAAWLIERAGLAKGAGVGPVGLSTRHTLALVNRGGASAAQVIELAGRVRRRVRDRFGVTLWPEPVFVGFDRPVAELLDS